MTDLRDKTCCFTGHREIPFVQKKLLCNSLRKEIIKLIEEGYLFFGTGGALGFDTLAAQTVLELKTEYPQIKLILVLPCTTQSKLWPEADRSVYDSIIRQADKVVYTSKEYTRSCMFERNRHLVNNSSVCVCFLTKTSGGTAYTVNYAKEKGLRIIPVKPALF